MRKLFVVAVLVGLSLCKGASAQNLLLHSGKAPAQVVAAGFQGPGDVVSGAKVFWGLRCYNTAYTGNVADVWDSATGLTTQTLITCSSGGILNETVNSLATTCASGCRIKTLYDQSGANSCGGGVCDLDQAINASRPPFTLNCIGSLSCLTFSGSQTLGKASFLSQAQPYTFSQVIQDTNSSAVATYFTNQTAIYLSLNTTPAIDLFAGTHGTVTISTSTWYAVQGVFNGASSIIYLNGSSNSVNLGTSAATTGTITFGSDEFADNFIGTFAELGLWPVGFDATQQSNMNSNQRAYWGF